MREYGYHSSAEAHRERRKWIQRGRTVSLVAYDPERDLYVFDVYPNPEAVSDYERCRYAG